MRLAIIAPQYPEYSIHYGRAMADRCEVLTCVDEGQTIEEYEERVTQVGKQHLYPMRFKSPWDLLKLVCRVLKFCPSVVHFQEASGPRRGFFNAMVATIMRPFALIVLTVHDPAPHTGRDADAARRTSWTRDYVRRIAQKVLVHGDHCARQYGALHLDRQEIVVSDHGIILEPIESISVPSNRCLYFFGRMEAYKGVEILLLAAEKLHNEGFDFELRIEGRGPELDRLQTRFRQLPEVSIFNGYVPPQQIITSIQLAGCILLPYLNATQSGVLASAFAGHRFVIASDTGGLRDLVNHDQNGILVPPGDPDALAAAIRTVIIDGNRCDRLRQGARDTANTRLDWNRIATNLYTNLSRPR
jgi:glycosyltransferase involved in cell wall biosynthesis